MVTCYPSTPKKLLMTFGMFLGGASIFAAGVHLSYVNVAPQQARTKARNDFVKQRLKQKYGKLQKYAELVRDLIICLLFNTLYIMNTFLQIPFLSFTVYHSIRLIRSFAIRSVVHPPVKSEYLLAVPLGWYLSSFRFCAKTSVAFSISLRLCCIFASHGRFLLL